MRTWNGLPLYECPECSFTSLDAPSYAEHLKRSGHKEAVIEVEKLADSEPEITAEEPIILAPKKKKSKLEEPAKIVEEEKEVNDDQNESWN